MSVHCCVILTSDPPQVRNVYGNFETISYLLMLVIFPGNNSVVCHNIRYAHNISWHTNSPKSPNKFKFIDFIDIITNHSHFLYILQMSELDISLPSHGTVGC